MASTKAAICTRCGTMHYKTGSKPAHTMTCWPIFAWLRMLLENEQPSGFMRVLMV